MNPTRAQLFPSQNLNISSCRVNLNAPTFLGIDAHYASARLDERQPTVGGVLEAETSSINRC
jgi:hypothetical protein